MTQTKVTIWNEFRHEKKNDKIREIYPEGIHAAIAKGINSEDLKIRTATLDEPEHGLTEEVLNDTDVLIWWGHCAHGEVKDEIVKRIQTKVLEGMGLIVLHSGHHSKIFKTLMGTNCSLQWREAGEKQRLWNVEPSHPVTQGIGSYIELPNEEMYGERFDIPTPDKIIFISWFEGGEVFRSGCCFERGHGKIFYFQPGHESYPTYYNREILRVISNAIHWSAPIIKVKDACPNAKPIEKITAK